MQGVVDGQQCVFLLDSGASSNFMSLQFAEQFGLSRVGMQPYSVRLANGKVVQTIGEVQLSVLFGSVLYLGTFHVLDCPVPLILGMAFLQKMKPIVDFGKKQVAIVHDAQRYQLPTCVIGKCSVSGKQQCTPTVQCSGRSSSRDDRSQCSRDVELVCKDGVCSQQCAKPRE